MAEEPETTPIQNKYAQQYAKDLASNREEQGSVSAQITGLQKRLEQLKAEEGWLAQAQGNLPAVPVPVVPEAQSAASAAEVSPAAVTEEAEIRVSAEAPADPSQTVPQQREEPVQPTKKKVVANKSAAKKAEVKTTARSTAKKTRAESAKKAATRKPKADGVRAQPAAAAEASAGAESEKKSAPLWQLLLDILLRTPGQPCVAREVREQLALEHPGRTPTAQTVRNNLVILVNKGLAEKSRQQGNVMYTANAAADTEPTADSPAGGGAEQADETASEKVPAGV